VIAGRRPESAAGRSEAVGLNKDFKLGRGAGRCTAVRDVSFNLYQGAVVALVGESGSGKSTVAKLLAGQERPTSGQIRLDGKPIDVRGTKLVPGVQE
jgi:ribose transport system ATP-binding protein